MSSLILRASDDFFWLNMRKEYFQSVVWSLFCRTRAQINLNNLTFPIENKTNPKQPTGKTNKQTNDQPNKQTHNKPIVWLFVCLFSWLVYCVFVCWLFGLFVSFVNKKTNQPNTTNQVNNQANKQSTNKPTKQTYKHTTNELKLFSWFVVCLVWQPINQSMS